MREGLRSGSLLRETEIDEVSQSQVLVLKGRDEITQKGSISISEECLQINLSGSGSDGKTSVLEFDAKGDGLEDTTRVEDSIVGGCTIVGLDRGKDNENSVVEKEVREGLLDVTDGKMQITGRVLRSRVVASGVGIRKGFTTESGGIVVSKRIRESDGSENELVMMEGQESDGSVGRLQKRLKRKRGRPPKVQGAVAAPKVELDEEVLGEKSETVKMKDVESGKMVWTLQSKLKRKRGRPPKVKEIIAAPKMDLDEKLLGALKNERVDMEEMERGKLDGRLQKKLKRKRGRPPKVLGAVAAPKMELDEEFLEALKESGRVEMEENESGKMVGRLQKKLKRKRGRPPKVPGTIAAPKIVLGEEVMGAMKKSGRVEMKEAESGKLVGRLLKKLKRKRGRPPKAKESAGALKVNEELLEGPRKRKRVKMQENESDGSVGGLQKKLQRKRGRARKLWRSYGPLKVDKDQMVGGSKKCKKATKFVGRVKRNYSKNSSVAEMRLIRKGLHAKNFMRGNNKGKKGGNTNEMEMEGQSRSEAKQVVRERIINMLFSAGWTIDYRPRNGKEYNDAVYINPEGQTHWSVTLAYNKLKEQYEDGGNESKTGNANFKFTPIPEEELNMLTRIVTKKREGKKKLAQTGNDEFATDGVNKKKKHKEKLNSVNSGCKSSKGKLKRKPLLFELDDSTGTSDKGTSISVRNFKRQEVHNRKRCALLARKSKEGAASDTDAYIPYNWKRTVLSWMIDLGIVPLNGKVQYMNQRRTSTLLHGTITREGIHCDCCSQILTLSKFEAHTGSKLGQQLQNIYLENGTSLWQCQLDSWNKQDESERKGFHLVDVNGEDPNDDTCGICGDGGDLICCDGCPSTFHQSCLDIDKFPSGEWHCVYCSCKFCGMVGGNTCQSGEAIFASLTCRLCEEKYHQSCIPSHDAARCVPCNQSYCGKNCKELFSRLEMLLGAKQDLEEGFSWTLIRRSDVNSDIAINGMPQKVECNSKLAVALCVMDECFLPLVDHRSGINLIRNILFNFGSNFSRLNFSGFVTAILEKDDEIITAASIRIHGNQFAEMPFIGTRHTYRRQGMCRRLLNAIESALCSLNVEKLVIPAISELRQTWTSVFGFEPLEASSKQKMRNMNMLVFPGIDMLQKPLLNHLEKEMIPSPGLVSDDLRKEQKATSEVANNSGDRGTASDDHTRATEVTHLDDCNKTSACSLGFVSDVHQLTQDVSDDQNQVSGSIHAAPSGMSVELDLQQNQHSISELGSKSVLAVAIDHEGQSVHVLREGTENGACRRKREGNIGIVDLHSSYESSEDHSAQNLSELHDVASIVQSQQVSDENVVCSDTQTSSLMSCDVNNDKYQEQLVANGTTHDACEVILDTHALKNNLDVFANVSVAPNNNPAALPVDSNPCSSCCDNGKSHMVVVPPVDTNCQPFFKAPSDAAAEPNLHNGLCTFLDFTSCAVNVNDCHELKESSAATQKDTGSLEASLLQNCASHSDSNSQIDRVSATQRNSESLCNSSSGSALALPCASSGVDACSVTETIILSNQAS